jgi:hypothetical protein
MTGDRGNEASGWDDTVVGCLVATSLCEIERCFGVSLRTESDQD